MGYSASYTLLQTELAGIDLRDFVTDYTPTKKVGSGVLINCPWHADNDPSMCVYYDHGFCFACGKHAKRTEIIAFFTKEVECTNYKKYVKPQPKEMPELEVSERLIESAHRALLRSPEKLRYLVKERRIGINLICEYKIGYITPPFRKYQRPRFAFPSWDFSGKLRTVGYRQDPYINYGNEYPDNKKYVIHTGTRSMLYNAHRLKDYEYVIHCGGQIDALNLLQIGINATGSMGEGAFRESWAQHFAGKRVYILLDNDEAGRKASLRTQVMIPHAEIIYWNERTPDKYDVSDLVADTLEKVATNIEPSVGTLHKIRSGEYQVRS
jgi:DNA primase